jgi:hypothetical protein
LQTERRSSAVTLNVSTGFERVFWSQHDLTGYKQSACGVMVQFQDACTTLRQEHHEGL